jgi:oxygen-independent coproporphyrinogen-3 oxidase
MYEEGTPLYRMLEEGKIKENDEETCRQMYETLINTLTQAGYVHYEISNFAKPGYRSRHNSNYWNDTHYLGLGAAAHSYNGKSRTWNISNISQYIDSEDNSQYEPIDARTHYNDTVTTALRTRDGIAIESVTEPYRSYLINNAQSDIQRGNLIIENNHLRLTRQGLFISDDVMSNLIWV